MHIILWETAPMIITEALLNGFPGSWERLVAQRLGEDALAKHSEAEVILESVGGDVMEAGYLVTHSTIQP